MPCNYKSQNWFCHGKVSIAVRCTRRGLRSYRNFVRAQLRALAELREQANLTFKMERSL